MDFLKTKKMWSAFTKKADPINDTVIPKWLQATLGIIFLLWGIAFLGFTIHAWIFTVNNYWL